jgi:hypothetical protein
MDLVPVPDECEDEQHQRNQQQPRGLRGIHRMPMMLMRVFFFGPGREHGAIVSPGIGIEARKQARGLVEKKLPQC